MSKLKFYVDTQLSEHIAETPEGFLICHDVPIARIGEYQYKASEVPIQANDQGMAIIQRDEAEVFSENTIKSFEGKPVTLNHPNDFVSPDNWAQLAHGHIQNVRKGEGEQDDLLISDIVLQTEDAIKLVKAGLREVSCGYDADYEQIEPGLGKQKNIIGNHLALVVKGRAGSRCAIHDAANICYGERICNDKTTSGKEEDFKMKTKDAKSFLRKLFPKLNLDGVKDEDLEMAGEENSAEAIQASADEAKEAAIKAVEAAKQANEIAQQIAQGVNKEGGELEQDEEGGEADPFAPMNEKLDQIASLLEQLVNSLSDNGGEEENLEEDADPELEENEGSEENLEEDADPELEENEEEKEKTYTGDAALRNVIARAEILSPGIVVSKPGKTTDMKKFVDTVKKKALSDALTKDTAKLVQPILGKQKVKDLSGATLDACFNAASELIKNINNARMQRPAMQMKDLNTTSELAKMNERNKDFWNKNKR